MEFLGRRSFLFLAIREVADQIADLSIEDIGHCCRTEPQSYDMLFVHVCDLVPNMVHVFKTVLGLQV